METFTERQKVEVEWAEGLLKGYQECDVTPLNEALALVRKTLPNDEDGVLYLDLTLKNWGTITVGVSNIKTVTTLLRPLALIGWHQDESSPPLDEPQYGTKKYFLTKGDQRFDLKFAFSGKCQFRKVGEETITATKAVYEFSCLDNED